MNKIKIMMSLLCDWEKRAFSRARAVLPQRGEKRQKRFDPPDARALEPMAASQTVNCRS
jgi:hypothetical protein